MFLSHAIDVVKVQLYHVACVAFSFVMIVVNQMKMTIQFALIVLLMNVSRVEGVYYHTTNWRYTNKKANGKA